MGLYNQGARKEERQTSLPHPEDTTVNCISRGGISRGQESVGREAMEHSHKAALPQAGN